MKCVFLVIAILSVTHAYPEKASFDEDLEAALEAYISSRDISSATDRDEDTDDLADVLEEALSDRAELESKSLNDQVAADDDGNDDDEDDDDDDGLSAMLAAYRAIDLNALDEGTDESLTEDEDVDFLLRDLAELEDSTVQDLVENKDMLDEDDGITGRSLQDKVAKDLLYRRLLDDHPDLRALGIEESEAGVLDKRGWFKKVKNFFKKIGRGIKNLWKKWKNRVISWLIRKGRPLACRFCFRPDRPGGMSRLIFKWLRNLIKAAACGICRRG